ncbi:MAG: hypothetical protein EXR67_01815 [Dehalococcoidia bacterium]|nr:hypothetical protein [Dehalococcoidia bacterium]
MLEKYAGFFGWVLMFMGAVAVFVALMPIVNGSGGHLNYLAGFVAVVLLGCGFGFTRVGSI